MFPRQDLLLGLYDEPANSLPSTPGSTGLLDAWVAGGIGHVTGTTEPTAPAGSVGLAAAARMTGYTKFQITGMAENGLLPWILGPRGRRQFDPGELLEIIAGWRRLAAKGIKPPNALPRQDPAPTTDP